jgi:membrane protein YqaA with SNARE-associated domain
MDWWRFLLVVVLAGVAGSFTDWLFMGVLFHDRYNAHPEVWRPGRTDARKILISSLIAAAGSAAFAYLLVRAGGITLDHGLAWAVLVWIVGPLPLLVINGQWLKIHPLVTVSHALGWLARFVVTAGIAAWLL